MSVRRLVVALAVCAIVLLFPAVALAAGNDVGANLAKLMKHYAAELYGGTVSFFGLGFLWNRQYRGLAAFLLAALVVGWMVFSPDQVASTSRSLGRQILS